MLIFPLPEYGHLSPTLRIADHYARQGCEVVYLSLPKFRAKVEAVQARLIPLLPGEEHGTGQQVWTQLAPHGSPGERGRVITERLRAVAAESPFDLFLLDWLFPCSFGCDVQAALGSRPRAYFSSTLLQWKPRTLPAALDGPLLLLCPAELEVARFRELPPEVYYAEPSFDPTAFGAGDLPVPLDGRHLVLAAWGSQSARYSALPALLGQLARLVQERPDCLFLVAVGSNPAAREALDSRPLPNLVVCESFEQQALLQKAAAMLTHGGLGTLKECILHQVPTLVTPYVTDQPFNAMRVAQAGLGAALFPEEQDFARLGAALHSALAGTFQASLKRMQGIFLRREEESPSHRLLDPFLA